MLPLVEIFMSCGVDDSLNALNHSKFIRCSLEYVDWRLIDNWPKRGMHKQKS